MGGHLGAGIKWANFVWGRKKFGCMHFRALAIFGRRCCNLLFWPPTVLLLTRAGVPGILYCMRFCILYHHCAYCTVLSTGRVVNKNAKMKVTSLCILLKLGCASPAGEPVRTVTSSHPIPCLPSWWLPIRYFSFSGARVCASFQMACLPLLGPSVRQLYVLGTVSSQPLTVPAARREKSY